MTDNTKIYTDIYETLYSSLDYHKSDSIYTTHYSNFIPNTLVKWKVKFNSVLDIGCSHGEGLKYLKDMGKEVYGIDISETAVKRAQTKGINAKVPLDSAKAFEVPILGIRNLVAI